MEEKKKILKWVGIGLAVTGGIALTVWAGPALIGILSAGATAVVPILNREDTSLTKSEEAERFKFEEQPEEESMAEKRSYTRPTEAVNCSSCIVNLPEGWHASEEKIRTAKENGFDLKDDQTWREEHTKYNNTGSAEEKEKENGN